MKAKHVIAELWAAPLEQYRNFIAQTLMEEHQQGR